MPGVERGTLPDPERIGKYDVVERIAVGGFATLYKGRDPFLKRPVAIKVCASDDAGVRQQFLREAEIAGRLDHPNIVRTFDFGFEKVGPYLVQEYLDGEDLSGTIERQEPLGPRAKLHILVQVAEGLAYSHALGILHLDIKPANVRIVERGQVKLLDFGIARLASAGSEARLGGMVGTAGYLPPEQVRGEEVDARADVFAFGALAYELLGYRRPFAGSTVQEILKQVFSRKPAALERIWPECPAGLSRLVARCLEKEPDARYAGFADLLPELVRIRDELPAASERLEGETSDRPQEPDRPMAQQPVVLEFPGVEAERHASSPTPSGDASPRRSRRLLLAAASVLLVLATVGWWMRGSAGDAAGGREGTARAVDETVDETGGQVASAGTRSAATGELFVTAVPWGKVVRISGEDGGELALEAAPVTPLRLDLPPGLYEVELAGPEGSVNRICRARVLGASTHVCHSVMSEPRVIDYFKEHGWWH